MDNCTGCGKEINGAEAWVYGVRCRDCFLADGKRDMAESLTMIHQRHAADREIGPYEQHVQEEWEHWFIGDEQWLANN